MSSDGRPRIIFEKDGPLRVEGLERFCNSRGDRITTKKTLSLCRCGASKARPYCDGTHASVGFSDAKSDDRVSDRLDRYEGRELTIRDNRGTCSHAGYCTSGLPSVWRRIEPWIDPDGASADEIVRVIRQCPSGALAWEKDGKIEDSYSNVPEIEISRNGPYRVRGGILLEGVQRGQGVSAEHATLCRCGQSLNKPFCDGSHWYAGFRDDEARTIAKASRESQESSTGWVRVGETSGLGDGRLHEVRADNRSVVITRTANGWKAIDGRCPHQGGPLAEGTLSDGAVRCPWHGFEFSLADGKGRGNDLEVATLGVRETDGAVEIAAPKPRRSGWTVSHVIAETLVDWGIDTVFGMVGHSNLGMAEALRVQERKGRLRYFGIRHEGAASFACSGYAKLTGRPAACLSIAGPGATNLLTGLWDAHIDRAPVLALTGQVNTQVIGPGAFQEIDLASAFEAVARFSQTVLPGSRHGELAALALKTAVVERTVAHLILPDEVQVLDAAHSGPVMKDGRVSPTAISPPPESVDFASYRIARARRPVIIVGYGAREAMDEILSLAEVLGSPVITTFKAKGQVSDRHPLGAGVLGRSGTPVASGLMSRADLLIVFGASFSDHTGIATDKPVIQVDFDRMALGRFHGVDEPVWGDIATTARLLLDRVGEDSRRTDQKAELDAEWSAWRQEKRDRAARDNGNGVNSTAIFEALGRSVPEDAVIAVDVGNNTYSFGRCFECARQSVLMSGYLGSIGFAFPAAMGAWAAAGERRIVSVSGDGGFAQYMGEFMTAVKYGMNITHVLLNNSELGKISKEQRDGEWKVWQTGLQNVDFAGYARLCGGFGVRVDRADQLEEAFGAALDHEGPALVEIVSDPLLT